MLDMGGLGLKEMQLSPVFMGESTYCLGLGVDFNSGKRYRENFPTSLIFYHLKKVNGTSVGFYISTHSHKFQLWFHGKSMYREHKEISEVILSSDKWLASGQKNKLE